MMQRIWNVGLTEMMLMTRMEMMVKAFQMTISLSIQAETMIHQTQNNINIHN